MGTAFRYAGAELLCDNILTISWDNWVGYQILYAKGKIQLAAIRSALDGVARLVFEDHMDSCILDAVETGNAEAKIAEIKTAFARYFI